MHAPLASCRYGTELKEAPTKPYQTMPGELTGELLITRRGPYAAVTTSKYGTADCKYRCGSPPGLLLALQQCSPSPLLSSPPLSHTHYVHAPAPTTTAAGRLARNATHGTHTPDAVRWHFAPRSVFRREAAHDTTRARTRARTHART